MGQTQEWSLAAFNQWLMPFHPHIPLGCGSFSSCSRGRMNLDVQNGTPRETLAVKFKALGLFAVAAGQWLRVVSVITTQRGLVRPILSEILLRVQRLVYL